MLSHRLTAKPIAKLVASAALLTLTACGDGPSDPVLDYLTSLDAATVVVRPAGLVQTSPADRALISNGNFEAPEGPTTGWTQRTGRTRFGNLGDLIGPIPDDLQPQLGSTTVARMCGYPYTFLQQQPDGSFVADSVSCSDRLTSGTFQIPSGTSALTLKIDAAGRITCPASWLTLVALMPVSDGAKVPAIQIKPGNTDLSVSEFKTFRFDIPLATLNGMIGKNYQLIVQGMSGSCKDPQMVESIVLVRGIRLTATVPN